MNNIINITEQLELSFNTALPSRGIRRRQTRIERAAWWFGKMRAAVDSAISRGPKPAPPPQQIWLAQPEREAA